MYPKRCRQDSRCLVFFLLSADKNQTAQNKIHSVSIHRRGEEKSVVPSDAATPKMEQANGHFKRDLFVAKCNQRINARRLAGGEITSHETDRDHAGHGHRKSPRVSRGNAPELTHEEAG
ncbi:MAG: hypothetical protein DMG39_29940 [Acidobacteria bacterium]|nr:MAG: hypothetical protein DMG39_29940 [Acidobacteriota bacterium]